MQAVLTADKWRAIAPNMWNWSDQMSALRAVDRAIVGDEPMTVELYDEMGFLIAYRVAFGDDYVAKENRMSTSIRTSRGTLTTIPDLPAVGGTAQSFVVEEATQITGRSLLGLILRAIQQAAPMRPSGVTQPEVIIALVGVSERVLEVMRDRLTTSGQRFARFGDLQDEYEAIVERANLAIPSTKVCPECGGGELGECRGALVCDRCGWVADSTGVSAAKATEPVRDVRHAASVS